MNLVVEMKDILLYDLGCNRYVICHEDWLINVKPVLSDIWMLLLGNFLKIVGIGRIEINVNIGGK